MARHRQRHVALASHLHPERHGGAHLASHRTTPPGGWKTILFIIGVLAVTVSVLGVLSVTELLTRKPAESPDARPSQTPASPATPSDNSSPALSTKQQALARCTERWTGVQTVLTAARPAMRQWEAHVDAMNKLVAGKITLDAATAYWARTQQAATRNLATFHGADARLSGECPAAAPEACAQAVQRSESTLTTARRSLATWALHVEHMQHLQMGMLSPAKAERLWVQLWRKGQRELAAYHHDEQALAAVGDQPCRSA